MTEDEMTEEARTLFVKPKPNGDDNISQLTLDAFGRFVVSMIRDNAIIDTRNDFSNGRIGKLE